MPLDKFVLLIVAVVAAAGLTVWIAALIFASLEISGPVWLGLVPALLVGYVIWRVIADRLRSAEDDHYDHIEK